LLTAASSLCTHFRTLSELTSALPKFRVLVLPEVATVQLQATEIQCMGRDLSCLLAKYHVDVFER